MRTQQKGGQLQAKVNGLTLMLDFGSRTMTKYISVVQAMQAVVLLRQSQQPNRWRSGRMKSVFNIKSVQFCSLPPSYTWPLLCNFSPPPPTGCPKPPSRISQTEWIPPLRSHSPYHTAYIDSGTQGTHDLVIKLRVGAPLIFIPGISHGAS